MLHYVGLMSECICESLLHKSHDSNANPISDTEHITMLTLSVKMLAFLTIDKKGSLWLNTDTKASLHLCFMLAASRMILYSCSADEALLMTIAVSARDARPRF